MILECDALGVWTAYEGQIELIDSAAAFCPRQPRFRPSEDIFIDGVYHLWEMNLKASANTSLPAEQPVWHGFLDCRTSNLERGVSKS